MTQDTGTLTAEVASLDAEIAASAAKALSGLIRPDDLVGDLLKIDYATCEVLVHDHLRQKVGGLPLGCFLLATRLTAGATPAPDQEDTCLVLLRVTGQSKLPNASETDMSRFLAGQRAAAAEQTWDAEGKTDQFTLHQLRYSGVASRVLGTFRMRRIAKDWKLAFGADISNFYSGRGMKVYKPVGAALRQIVNFMKPGTDESHPLSGKRVPVGRVRYASSERAIDTDGENVEVDLDPTDLIARRTALFGMSRTGKSNTTKVIAASVFRIRETDSKRGRVGQLIFDVNGEYANENTQDGGLENPSCLKNVGAHTKNAHAEDVVTYGLWPHPNDSGRKIVKINFFGANPTNWQQRETVAEALDTLYVGKTLVDAELADYGDKYIKSFAQTSLEPPKEWDASSSTRYQRVILAYRAALTAANFQVPTSQKSVRIKSLFSADLRDALKNSSTSDGNDAALYQEAGGLLDKEFLNWDEAVRAMQGLRRFMADKNSGFQPFNSKYMSKHDGRQWADPSFVNILEIFAYPNGVRALLPVAQSHSPDIKGDFAQSVVEDLLAGRLVIFDQSLGDPDQNAKASERIMWAIFNRQKQAFIVPEKAEDGSLKRPPDVLVYAEEAHNLLPANSSPDVSNIWSRVAKEGSKYRIGLVYATQEPSSIQSNIMKNTDNWFVAHLNNSDETKELRKYYDFDDFVQSILQVPDPGFLRMRTLSNPYIVPVQVNRFEVKA